MRRFIQVVVAFLLLLGSIPGAPSVTAASASQERQAPKSVTVYVTRTGQKYHRDGCRYLRQSRIAMALSEAAKRFDPCKVCKPPVP